MSSKGKDAKKAKDPSNDIYQAFLEFLKSPMWVLPVMSFVEQRSVVFDKEQGDEQLYSKIHSEFRGMVDLLIQCFCDDSGVKPHQVAEAIKRGEQGVSGGKKGTESVNWSLLEPVIAANDFNLFVHMMIRKNIELQLQAVQMIEIMCGLIPSVLLPGVPSEADASNTVKNADEQEKIILLQVMRQSKEDYEKQMTKNKPKSDELENAMKESIAEKERLMEAQKQEEQLVQEALHLSMRDDSAPRSDTDRQVASRKSVAAIQPNLDVKELPGSPSVKARAMSMDAGSETGKIRVKMADDPSNVAARSKMPADYTVPAKVVEPVTDEAVRKRQEYLRQQRDKLLAMKREAREVAFSQAETEGKQNRPKTARAAKAALRGGLKGDTPPVSDDVLAARRALVEKLKQEVIGNV